GAMKTGFQYIAAQKKTVYYNASGQMQYGQQHINSKWYLFDQNTGAMKTGFQYIAAQKKTVYYNASGQMQYGQQHINSKWYLFDQNT
ncbi:N-acetylmuramoyl-L-alanine amidase family protein, partial [Streptomyces brasiliscabiei]